MLSTILVYSKALQDYYQVAHWTCKNTVYYADHLLFGRLYDEAGKHIDALGEKHLGIGKPSSELNTSVIYKAVYNIIKNLPYDVKENSEFAKAALDVEAKLIELCVQVDSAEDTSIGVKNFVGQIADDAEGRIYLLKQRLAKSAPSSLV